MGVKADVETSIFYLKKWNINHIYLVISLIIVSAALRLPGLKMGLWRDEGSTYFDAIPSHFGDLVKTVAYSELNPPGFYVLMHQWMQWFGTNDIIFKLPAFIFGLLLIPVTYMLGWVACSSSVGLIAAFIATFSPTAIYFSQEARPYTLTALLCSLVILLYLQYLRSPHPMWYLLGFVLCSSLLLYAQYTGLLLIISLVVITCYLGWCHVIKIQLLPLAISFGIIWGLFIPWLSTFLVHLQTGLPWTSSVLWVLRPLLFFRNLASPIPLPYTGKAAFWYEVLRVIIVCLMMWPLRLEIKQLWATFRLNPPQVNQLNQRMNILCVCFLMLSMMQAARSDGRLYLFPYFPIAWVLYGHWLIQLFRYLQKTWPRNRFQVYRPIIVGLILILLMVPNLTYSLALGTIQKSGIKLLTTNLEQWSQVKTIYLVSPCHLGPTFGYYVAQAPVHFYGFARWENPELFSPQGYAKLWNNPTLITDTERYIHEQVNRHGYQQLALIHQSNIKDRGQVRYSRSNQLLAKLKQTYPLISQTDYPGYKEPVTLYLFDLNHLD